MGDTFKESIFNECVASTLHVWAGGARKKKKIRGQSSSLMGPTVHMNSDLSFGSEVELARMEPACGESFCNAWHNTCEA